MIACQRHAFEMPDDVAYFNCDATRVRVDYVACAAYKWLLGPYSIGFLYAAEAHHGGEPLEYNWITRERSEDFAGRCARRTCSACGSAAASRRGSSRGSGRSGCS